MDASAGQAPCIYSADTGQIIMTEKIQQAIDKLDKEADSLHYSSATIIASHIIDTYLTSDDNAEKVLNKKKSFANCLNNIKSKAKRQAVNNMAMVDHETVYGWVKDYYGFAVDCKENKIIDLLDFI